MKTWYNRLFSLRLLQPKSWTKLPVVCCSSWGFNASCKNHEILYVVTPPKTNMEPENWPLEKENPIGNHLFFKVLCSFSRGSNAWWTGTISQWEPKALKTLLETGALSGVPEGDEETGRFVRKGYPNSLEGPKVWTLKIPWFGRFPFEMIFLFSQKSCFRFLRFGKYNPGFVVRMMCLFVLPVVLWLRGLE